MAEQKITCANIDQLKMFVMTARFEQADRLTFELTGTSFKVELVRFDKSYGLSKRPNWEYSMLIYFDYGPTKYQGKHESARDRSLKAVRSRSFYLIDQRYAQHVSAGKVS